jgi:hypothetical protein
LGSARPSRPPIGVGKSGDSFIPLTAGGTVASLGFSKPTARRCPSSAARSRRLLGPQRAGRRGHQPVRRPVVGNRLVWGIDTATTRRWRCSSTRPTPHSPAQEYGRSRTRHCPTRSRPNPDDPLTLGGLGVAAGKSLEFDFNALHSGSNLFGTVGDADNALIVIAENPVIASDGTLVSSPNGVIKTSQGGGPTTIGVNSQMFDPGEGAYFTYAKNPNTNFLGANLSQTEANDADNILYTGGTLTASGASTTISQTQGNGAASMKITAFDIANAPQARDFVSGLGSGTTPTITSVKVNGVAVSFTPDGNGVIVGGLKSGDTIDGRPARRTTGCSSKASPASSTSVPSA